MAKASGGTRGGQKSPNYINMSLTQDYVEENRKQIGEYIDKNVDKFAKALDEGTLPDWITRDPIMVDALQSVINARKVGPRLQEEAERIAEKNGGVVTPINYKGFESTRRKMLKDGPDIGDAARNTIVIGKSGISGTVADLKDSPIFEHHHAQNTSMGYTGNLVNVRINGVKGEIQVNTPKMIYAKETPENAKKILGTKVWNRIRSETGQPGGLGHTLYEKARTMPPGKELEDIARQSREYYSHFKD